MSITYGEAKKILKKYAGVAGSCSPDELDLFVKKTLQYMLYSGEHGNERKFCFHAVNGCFTLPPEIETPLKVKIGDKVGQVWSRWFEYHSGLDLQECVPADKALLEEPNYFATVYDLPKEGALIGALATCSESEDAHIIVKGIDLTGREVYTVHKGEKIHGEYLSLRKGRTMHTTVKFGKITEITKTVTNGYVNLLWISEDKLKQGFLADYDPYETSPEYRRVRIISQQCPGIMKVSLIGRIRLKKHYADNDRLPFDNYYALDIAGQGINSARNNEVEISQAKDNQLQVLLEREGNYKKVNTGIPVDMFKGTSPGGVIKPLHRRMVRRRYR